MPTPPQMALAFLILLQVTLVVLIGVHLRKGLRRRAHERQMRTATRLKQHIDLLQQAVADPELAQLWGGARLADLSERELREHLLINIRATSVEMAWRLGELSETPRRSDRTVRSCRGR
ncbi:DUF6082 family protein [Streptomyces sp. NPDC006365]|uniref:DUF6082 family protein n=1 Tax=Streptomyces sp. NPDC006365 TaxID=3364744 RepID=UPI0036AB27E4